MVSGLSVLVMVFTIKFEIVQGYYFNEGLNNKINSVIEELFNERANKNLSVNDRRIIPNDTKLFAQADCNDIVEFYLSSDSESFKVYSAIKNKMDPDFQFIDLKMPHHEVFGILD